MRINTNNSHSWLSGICFLQEPNISEGSECEKYYCAYRNSVNNAFLRLFRYVRTGRTMTIKI